MGNLEITATGPASRFVSEDALSSSDCEIVPTAKRCPVVLVAVYGDVEPTRADLDLIYAVSHASGRCAVGLFGDGVVNPQWREAIPAEIPVGGIDSKMGRTLYLLSQGPARAHGRNAVEMKRRLLQEQLSRERARRAQQHSMILREQREDMTEIVQAGIEDFADFSVGSLSWNRYPMDAQELEARCDLHAEKVEERIRDELGLDCSFSVPVVPQPTRPTYLVEAVVGLLVLGAAIGFGRLLVEPFSWIGAPKVMSEAIAVAIGVALAVIVVWSNVRRKAQQSRREWVARYAVAIRRAWEREVDDVISRQAQSTSEGWRARELAEAIRKL